MLKKISVYSLLFALLLTGKVGHVGTLGELAWWHVFSPLFLEVVHDIILSYLLAYGKFGKDAWTLQGAIMKRIIANRATQSTKTKLNG